MKKILIATITVSALALAGGAIMARGWGWGGHGYHHGYYNGYGYHHMEFLKDELNLSEKQVEAIITINAEYRVKFFKNRDNADAIEKLRLEQQNKIENILNADQKKKYADLYRNRIKGGYGCALYSY